MTSYVALAARSSSARISRSAGFLLVLGSVVVAPHPAALAQPTAPTESTPATDEPQPAAEDTSVPAEPTSSREVAAETTAAPVESPAAEPTPTVAPAAAAAPPAPPTRLGPYAIELPNGSDISLGFFGQFRSTTTNEGGQLGDGAARSTETGIELRRIRLYVRGNFLDDRLALLLQLSTSPSSLELVDFSLDGEVTDGLSIRFGQFKTPFTMHRFRAFSNLSMTEWDIAAVRFGSERQIGFEAHGPAPREHHLDYSLGLFTGVNARAAFARGVAETYAEPIPNPSNLRSAQAPTEVHPEVIGRFGYASDDAEPLILSDARGGGLRYYGGVSAAYDFRPNRTQDFAARVAAEGMLKFEHLMVNAVGYLGFVDPAPGPFELGMIGATLDVAYRIKPRFEIVARYSRVDTLTRFRHAAHRYVDQLVANADPADAPDVLDAHSAAGQTRYLEEYAVGFNVPIVGRSLAIQTDFAILRTERVGTDDEDTLRMRTQLQFGF